MLHYPWCKIKRSKENSIKLRRKSSLVSFGLYSARKRRFYKLKIEQDYTKIVLLRPDKSLT